MRHEELLGAGLGPIPQRLKAAPLVLELSLQVDVSVAGEPRHLLLEDADAAFVNVKQLFQVLPLGVRRGLNTVTASR